MNVSDKLSTIANNFDKYTKIRDKSLIKKYTLEELKQVKYKYSRDSNSPFYKAIEDRIKEIEEIGKLKRWVVTLVIIVITAILSLLTYLKLGK